ncbi:MAG: trypsin-like peptidase domain-containing protein [Clostridia bacterium]|nr:trypsin-like peptidase domain-containing protein [Clostridia bacterium]
MYESNRNERSRSRTVKTVAIALVLCLTVGIFGIALAEDKSAVLYESTRPATAVEVVSVAPGELMNAAQVYAANVASTVGIRTETTVNYLGYATPSAAAGSGFIVTENGYIVTNAHVVSGANKITVTTHDDKSYEAKLIGSDERNDLAVLKIEAEGLKPAVLGSSSAINIGDEVVAIGNPLGELTFSLTGGIISAKDREITISGGTAMSLLQTDCSINSGNSGGALFNMYGEVVGITNAKYSSSSSGASVDNIGFAIPIDQVKPIIKSIIETGRYVRPYIGVSIADVSDEMKNYGIPAGAAVKSVTEGGPAAAAGLLANDIITAADGTAIENYGQLSRYISTLRVGDEIVLSVYRQGQTLELKLTIGEYKEEPAPTATEQQPAAGNSNGNGNGTNPYSGNPYGSSPYGSSPYGFGMDDFFDYFFGNGRSYRGY